MKRKSRRISIVLSSIFIALFIILFVLSIVFTVLSYPSVEPIEGEKSVDWFSTQITNSYDMNIPFSIVIQFITSISGVFFGIRIGQWIDEKEEIEKESELWKKVYRFLTKLKSGISNDSDINELYEYKIYWESLQHTDAIATKRMQEDERYCDVSYVFSFLSYYRDDWSKYSCVHKWEINAPDTVRKRIDKWEKAIEELIVYTQTK